MAERTNTAAIIPARGGSKRIPNKNVRAFAGMPMIAHSIKAAQLSGLFDRIIVTTDSEEIARIARHYGAEVPFLRPDALAGDRSPDIDWVAHTLQALRELERPYECFSLLRPTSPFRTPETLQRAWAAFSPTTPSRLSS